jgi:uncharacterized integral membrane protein
MQIKLVVTLILAGMAVLFIFQNVAAVEIQLLFWSIQISRSLLMILMLVIGMLMGWFLHSYWSYRKSSSSSPIPR